MHTIKRGFYSVEKVELGVISKDSVQCKGHSENCHLLMWQGIFQVSFHHHHDVNIYYEDAVQVWIIHARSKRGFSFSPKPSEGACALLCLPFSWKG